MSKSNFKATHSIEKLKAEADRIRSKYPDRIPVIAEKAESCTTIDEIDKKKYLVPADLTASQFMMVLRKRLHLHPDQAMFLFIDDELPSMNELMAELYRKHKDETGFIFITYSGESTFG